MVDAARSRMGAATPSGVARRLRQPASMARHELVGAQGSGLRAAEASGVDAEGAGLVGPAARGGTADALAPARSADSGAGSATCGTTTGDCAPAFGAASGFAEQTQR